MATTGKGGGRSRTGAMATPPPSTKAGRPRKAAAGDQVPDAPPAVSTVGVFRVNPQDFDPACPVDQLRLHPDNAREGDVGAIWESIQENGFFGALLVQRSTGYILKGNHTYKASLAAGASHVPVLWLDVDDAAATRILLVDNAASDRAGYDNAGLQELLRQVLDDAGTLAGTGYTTDDLDALIAAAAGEGRKAKGQPAGDAEEDQLLALRLKWGTEPGQVWQVPSVTVPGAYHRLACGDSRDPEHVARLMAGRRAHLVYTDPPYGVEYESRNEGLDLIEGDELTGVELEDLVTRALVLAAQHTVPEAAFYVWYATLQHGPFAAALRSAGLVEKAQIIWVKQVYGAGWGDYRWQHEPCFYAGKEGCATYFHAGRDQSTVWRLELPRGEGDPLRVRLKGGALLTFEDGTTLYVADQAPKHRKVVMHHHVGPDDVVHLVGGEPPSDVWEVDRDAAGDYLHPTQKPVQLAERALRNSSKPGDTVLDLFHGGGALAVAAELTQRVAYTNELDPRYLAYELERLANMGLTPELLEKGP